MQTGKSLSIAKLTNCLFQEQHLMSNDLGMKKVSTHKMGTEQLSTLSTEREANPNNDFDRMVTGDETCLYYDDLLSQQEADVWKKSDEETETRYRRTRSAEKIIFWDNSDILLSTYPSDGTMTNGPYYASMVEQLRSPIVEKGGGNAPVDNCNVAHTAFVELNHLVYSPDVALSDSYLFLKWNKFVRLKNFSGDDETIDTVDEYLNKLD